MNLYTCNHGANLLKAEISFGAWDERHMREGDVKIVADESDVVKTDDGRYDVIGFKSVKTN